MGAELSQACEIAHYIAEKCAPASVALTKRLIWEHLNIDGPLAAVRREARGLVWLGGQADAAEGVISFVEKRKPQWKLKPSTVVPVD